MKTNLQAYVVNTKHGKRLKCSLTLGDSQGQELIITAGYGGLVISSSATVSNKTITSYLTALATLEKTDTLLQEMQTLADLARKTRNFDSLLNKLGCKA